MYLRTPKRYSSRRGRTRLISLRWLWLWILTPVVVFAGLYVYNNQDEIVPEVQTMISGVVDDANSQVATARAPEPTPTEDPTQNIQRANDAWALGAIQEAVSLYSEIIDTVPNDVAVHYHYTMGLIMQGQEDDALVAAENTVTANPFTADAWSVQAMAYNANGMFGDAISSALQALDFASQEAVEANPAMAVSRARALSHLAEAYYYAEQYERAQSTVNEALELDPDTAHAYYVEGLLDQGARFDLVSARDSYTQAYTIAPNLPYLGTQLALAETALGNYPEMEALYEEILELNPQNTPALFRLGSYYFSTVGDWSRAADYLRRCVDAEPSNARCHYQLGRALERQELYTDALESFERAVNTSDTGDALHGRYHYWLASVKFSLVDCNGAITDLQNAFRFASQLSDDITLSAIPDLAAQCGTSIGGAVAPTPTPTPAAEA